jgi:hypothetical protein
MADSFLPVRRGWMSTPAAARLSGRLTDGDRGAELSSAPPSFQRERPVQQRQWVRPRWLGLLPRRPMAIDQWVKLTGAPDQPDGR